MPKLVRASASRLPGPGRNAAGRPMQKRKKLPSVKNQIRAIERVLRKEGLDAKIRKKEHARLQQLREDAEAHKAQELERKYAVRYHKIRFFERVKLERRIKQLEREAKSVDPSTTAPINTWLAQTREDLQYVVNYPKGEKYVSLLRNTEDPEAQKALEAERKRIRAKVKQQLADIAMITQPDEGNPQVLKQPAQPLASPATSQDMLKMREEIPQAQALRKAALTTQTSKRKAVSAESPEQPPLKSSKLLPALAASPPFPSRASRHTAGAPGSNGGQHKGTVAGGDAEPDDIRADDFFMSSSADEAERDEQSVSVKASEVPAALPHESIVPKQLHSARDSKLPKHSNLKKSMQHRRKLPPGQKYGEHGHKAHAGATLPPDHKAVKHSHSHGGAAKQVARGKLSAKAKSQPSRSQPHGQDPSANAAKQSPGAAPDKRPGQPLRTRAEGGRKRRK